MSRLPIRSPYLVCATPVARANRRLWLSVWRRSVPKISWRFRTAIGVMCWGIMLAAGTYTTGVRQEAAFASPVSSRAALADAITPGVNTLGPGPTGQLLPPGTLAPYGTYRNSYMAGQCTWYVASRRKVPSNWGNARTWLSGAQRAGMNTGSVPAIGAIAWTSAGYYGHVALVEQISGDRVLVSEMNYNGPYRIDQRWASASSFRYIY